MFEFNKDWKERDRIMIPYLKERYNQKAINYDVLTFGGLPLEILQELLDKRFIDPEEKQNESPSVIQFKSMMTRYPTLLAHGYIVSPKRNDYRISIEGLHIPKVILGNSLKFIKEKLPKYPPKKFLKEHLKNAHEFIFDEGDQMFWCWWS
jgi:hypothetical protein